jgi:hypothetical protein
VVVRHGKSAIFARRNGRASFIARTPKAKAAQSLLGHETFGLYDSLLFIGKPGLSPYGFKRSRTVYQNELRPPKADFVYGQVRSDDEPECLTREAANSCQ